MIEFLLTSWWIYVPIVGVLLFLTHRNNQKIKHIKRERAIRALEPTERESKIHEFKRKPTPFDNFLKKYGLNGLFNHIFPKK